MAGEHINNPGPEHTGGAWQPPQPEAAPSFGGPAKTEQTKDSGKKDGKSKDGKSKKTVNSPAAAGQSSVPEKPRTTEPPRQTLAELADTIWQREHPKDGVDTQAPQRIGEKAFAAATAEAAADDTASNAGHIESESSVKPLSKDLPTVETEAHPPAAAADAPEAGTVDAVASPDNPARDILTGRSHDHEPVQSAPESRPVEEPRFRQQPQIQHAARMEQPSDKSDGDKNSGRNNDEAGSGAAGNRSGPETPDTPDRPQTAENVVSPPPVPPDSNSYRHRFWKEEPASTRQERVDAREIIPPTFDYEYAARNQAPFSEQPVGTVAAGSAVASRLYESRTPPGLQRNTADVSRAAWTGLLAGWWLGHRGKNKAVEHVQRQAAVTEQRAGQAVRQAEYATMTADRRATTAVESARYEAAATAPRQSKFEAAAPVASVTASRRPPERPASTVPAVASVRTETLRTADFPPPIIDRITETVTIPLAATAAVTAYERSRPRRETEGQFLPPAARAAGIRAAERAVVTTARSAGTAESAGFAGVAGQPAERLRPVPGARAERQLSKREALRIAKDIKVDGVSIKEVFKSKRIDEEGMRAVVDTFMRGGDIRQQLEKEVVDTERKYELDPFTRKQPRDHELERQPKAGRDQSGQGRERLGRVLSQAKDSVVEQGGKVGGVVATATQKSAKTASKAVAKGAQTVQRDLIDNSNTADWLSITAVVVLYSIILILLLKH